MNITIEMLKLPESVVIINSETKEHIFDGKREDIPVRILKQTPENVFIGNEKALIYIVPEKIYYDTEAGWFYTESFFRSQYDEYSEEEKENYSFEKFMIDTLKYEPIFEVE